MNHCSYYCCCHVTVYYSQCWYRENHIIVHMSSHGSYLLRVIHDDLVPWLLAARCGIRLFATIPAADLSRRPEIITSHLCHCLVSLFGQVSRIRFLTFWTWTCVQRQSPGAGALMFNAIRWSSLMFSAHKCQEGFHFWHRSLGLETRRTPHWLLGGGGDRTTVPREASRMKQRSSWVRTSKCLRQHETTSL